MNYSKNQYVRLIAESLCGNGNAIARDKNGFVFFLKGGVPGDTVIAKIIKVTKNYAVAIIDSFEEKSALRTDDGCKYASKCGGCVFQNIGYNAECEYKRSTVNDDFKRIAGLSLTLTEYYPCDSINNYRNKAVYPVAQSGDGKIITGYFAQNSHRICEHNSCNIANASFPKIRDFIINFCTANKISAYDEISQKGVLRHIYIRSAHDNSFTLTLVLNCERFGNALTETKFINDFTENFKNCSSVLINVNTEKTNSILGEKWRKLFGDGYMYDKLLEKRFRISPASFYQVNRKQAELLYSKAAQMANIYPGNTILDLYCGTGTIGICLAKSGCKLYGVEISSQAVIDAEFNAKINNVDGEFICLDAGEALNSERIRKLSPNVIIIDPPRKGCGEETVKRISSFMSPKIVYISCDPATLARDLKYFKNFGYTAQNAVGVDMFPRTGHVESIVLLTQTNNSD